MRPAQARDQVDRKASGVSVYEREPHVAGEKAAYNRPAETATVCSVMSRITFSIVI